jgi:hypothetical protein
MSVPWPASSGDGTKTVAAPDCSGNKKGRGETAPTFLIITCSPVPVHPWSKASGDAAIASGRSFPALISKADDGDIGGLCVENKSHIDEAGKAAKKPHR